MLPVTTKQYKSMVKKISEELWDNPNLFERSLTGECVLNVIESHKPKPKRVRDCLFQMDTHALGT